MTVELSGEPVPRFPAARFAYDVFVVHADAAADTAIRASRFFDRRIARCSYKRYISSMQIGTRELKNRLSHYLRRIRESREPIYVTDRGEIVAELRPVADGGVDGEVLLALAATGELSLGNGRRFKNFKPIKPRRAASLAGIVLEDRR
jgi:antitoxin (DNA-binding transcriptional repressor) of toxin-antitoxin stability system